MSVHYIPKGHHAIAPYFVVKSVHSLIDFLTTAFGAEVMRKLQVPDGRIAHAEIKIGDSLIMAGEREPAMKLNTHIYVKDVDATYERCLKAGGKSLSAPVNHPYGDRGAGVEDPQGNIWWIATHVEEVSDAEVLRRFGKRS